MEIPKYPNAFIIGVQKAGTTTLDDWISQHPQVYCYDALKDVHLFGLLPDEEIRRRMAQEPVAYKEQPVVLQSAVNYIFYPQMLQAIKEANPDAKLILIIRNPVDRAVSAYHYFQKMLRETRNPKEALLYKPATEINFSKDNNDFTYIEHGLYHRQISECLKYFSKDNLLVLHYADLAANPEKLLQDIFEFLGIDKNFKPDLSPKNITGEVKNEWLQKKLIGQGKLKKMVVRYLVDPWMPRSKRRLMKQKMFEMNTGKKTMPSSALKPAVAPEMVEIKKQLVDYFIDDTKKLDQLLGTDYFQKWFPGNN